jgi:hypothetical protein
MKIKGNKHTYSVKKFLLLPLIFRGKFYWLKTVNIEKAYNGYKFLIVSVN